MGFLSFLRKSSAVHSPDVADLLTLLGLTASAKDFAHAFYQKHYVAIDEALSLCVAIRTKRSALVRLLDFTQISPEETAAKVRVALSEAALDDELAEVLDARMPELLIKIKRLLQDSSCPDRLKLCQWMAEELEWPAVGAIRDSKPVEIYSVGDLAAD